MGMPKNELITKLEEISVRYKNTIVIQDEMDGFVPDDHYERKIRVSKFPGQVKEWEEAFDHESEDAVQMLEKAYERAYCPKEPAKPNIGKRPEHEPNLANELKKKQGCLPLVGGFIAVCSLISGGLFSGEALTVIINLAILAACAVVILVFFVKHQRAKAADKEVTRISIEGYEHHKKEQEENYEREMEVYLTERAAYLVAKGDFLEEYTAWRAEYLAHLREEEEIEEKLEADRAAGVKRIYEEQYVPAKKELEAHNDLITEEYLPVLNIIIELIKSGRADGLKEAINLYEELVYRERQLEQERQAEENRQREAQQQMQMQAQQHAEQMKFQQAQERQRKYEAQQQLRMQEQQHKDEMKMQEARLQQEAAAVKASRQKRCVWCAHKLTCRQQYYDGAYNCTGFTPQ